MWKRERERLQILKSSIIASKRKWGRCMGRHVPHVGGPILDKILNYVHNLLAWLNCFYKRVSNPHEDGEWYRMNTKNLAGSSQIFSYGSTQIWWCTLIHIKLKRCICEYHNLHEHYSMMAYMTRPCSWVSFSLRNGPESFPTLLPWELFWCKMK